MIGKLKRKKEKGGLQLKIVELKKVNYRAVIKL